MSEVKMMPSKAAQWLLAILVLVGFVYLEGGMVRHAHYAPNATMQMDTQMPTHCEKHPGCCEKPRCEKPRCSKPCEKPRCEKPHCEKHCEKPKCDKPHCEKPKCGKCGDECSSLEQSEEAQAEEAEQNQL